VDPVLIATPLEGRLLVPVLAASAGAGRSTTTALLAQAVVDQRVLVVDAAERVSSLWAEWVEHPGLGIAGLDESIPGGIYAHLTRLTAANDRLDVLTDVRHPLDPPGPTRNAGDWHRIAALTSHPVVIADTRDELLPLLVRWSHCVGDVTALLWLSSTASRPLLCVPSSGRGIDEALETVTLLEELHLSPHRLTCAVVGLSASDLPRWVRAGLTLLEPRVAGIVRLPHSRRLVAGERPLLGQADSRTRRAYAFLARHLTTPSTATAAVSTQEDTHALATTR